MKKSKIIFAIVVFVLLFGVFKLVYDNQLYRAELISCKNELLYEYKYVPDIKLENTLYYGEGGWSGKIKGFVKFDNIEEQPKGLRQYYVINALDFYDDNGSQYFSLEEVVAMPSLPPEEFDAMFLVTKMNSTRELILEDEGGNQFLIDRLTNEVSMIDVTGDSVLLITSNAEYEKFIKNLLSE